MQLVAFFAPQVLMFGELSALAGVVSTVVIRVWPPAEMESLSVGVTLTRAPMSLIGSPRKKFQMESASKVGAK